MEDKFKSDGDQSRRLELLLDVPLDLSVELGRTRMSIQDLLSLGPGSVVELDKIAGEPLDILVNNRLVARGEVVVVNDKFGVRITDIVSPSERIAKLR
jgi:flagellar motor switch protein FliN/FliY